MGMRTGPLLLAVAVLLALAGCVPSESHATAPPSASATPVFASDAEALAAAEKAYAAYLRVSDEVANDGGKAPERIAKYVTSGRFKSEIQTSALFLERGIRTTGSTDFDSSILQQVEADGIDTKVTFYTCWDTTAVRVIDSNGNDVTPADRIDRQTLEVVLTTARGRLPLQLNSDDAWSGQSSC
jgi:hypothetical protein